jgi:DNA-binding beta-propeller fold protein YncE
MDRFLTAALAAFAVIAFTVLVNAQQRPEPSSTTKNGSTYGKQSATPVRQRPLVLSGSIPLDGVRGRFDHFASGQGRLFVSALGNNTVEVISLFGGIVEHTITGVPNPQGVAFSPEAHKLFVASAKGQVYIYDGDSFNLITTINFEGGADNLRYDATTKRVYVGCGDDEKNGLLPRSMR